MAQIKSIVISTSRKVTANYSTREAAYTVTVELGQGETPADARNLLNAWTERLQKATDRAVGDPQGPTSFAHTTRYEPPFPVADQLQQAS
jgi:hypothetical protein